VLLLELEGAVRHDLMTEVCLLTLLTLLILITLLTLLTQLTLLTLITIIALIPNNPRLCGRTATAPTRGARTVTVRFFQKKTKKTQRN
jgi:hypothetical protein